MTLRTSERIFKRLHEANLMTGCFPEDYTFHSYKLKPHDLSAGAMKWVMINRNYDGPTITSAHTVNDCCSGPVERFTCGYHYEVGSVEIMPMPLKEESDG